MSNLVVFGFDGIQTADEVLNKLRSRLPNYLPGKVPSDQASDKTVCGKER